MRKIQATFVLSMMLIVSACSMDTSNKHQDAMDLATAWVTAYLTSKDSALSMIDNSMSSVIICKFVYFDTTLAICGLLTLSLSPPQP